jgi:2-iminobutanoate/2-iminopropanoate deaminase
MKSSMREEFRVEGLAEPVSHYADAVRYGDLLAPVDERGRVVGEEDVAAQARQVFVNMKKILEAAGTSFDNVLKVTVYLTSVADRTKINPRFARSFLAMHGPRARSLAYANLRSLG